MTEPSSYADRGDTFYRTLLESTRAIPWKIDWATKTFTYVGPQIETLLGWPQTSWVSVQDWADRMHDDDRDRVVDYCLTHSAAGEDHEADYRALTRDGDYLWVRDVVHILRDESGAIEALVGFMFDIDQRRRNEEKLAALQKKLENLSYQDALTGLANRRRFDEVMEREWASGWRNGTAVALIMVDIDHFKQYNDHYGHIQGDDCLRRVAAALAATAGRPRDLVCRFGGEEFILVLPETDHAAAMKMAGKCRDLIRTAAIEHAGARPESLLTVSMGVGACIPGHEHVEIGAFLHEVDHRLYEAKRGGRDRIIGEQQESAAHGA